MSSSTTSFRRRHHEQGERFGRALAEYEASNGTPPLERIPIRRRDEIVLVPVPHIASIVAEGELLHITAFRNERHTLTYRLKDLEARLHSTKFVRLGRETLVNADSIVKVNVMPGGTHVALLINGQKLRVSRLQSRTLRERFLRL